MIRTVVVLAVEEVRWCSCCCCRDIRDDDDSSTTLVVVVVVVVSSVGSWPNDPSRVVRFPSTRLPHWPEQWAPTPMRWEDSRGRRKKSY